MDIAVTFRAPGGGLEGQRPDRCERCGSQGFNLHQHATKALKDPATARAPVVRFICKRCRKTMRLYPSGVDAARQTIGLRQVSVLLYWLGLSYDGIREHLGHLGCPLSKATVWANVRASGLLGDRRRLRADPGTLVVQPRSDGATARFLVKGRAVTVRLARGGPGEMVLWVGALQPEAAQLMHRRTREGARRLGLRAELPDRCEAARA